MNRSRSGKRSLEVRPAYSRIQQTAPESFDLLWRVPARVQMRLALYVQLPEPCENIGEVRAWQQGGTFEVARGGRILRGCGRALH